MLEAQINWETDRDALVAHLLGLVETKPEEVKSPPALVVYKKDIRGRKDRVIFNFKEPEQWFEGLVTTPGTYLAIEPKHGTYEGYYFSGFELKDRERAGKVIIKAISGDRQDPICVSRDNWLSLCQELWQLNLIQYIEYQEG